MWLRRGKWSCWAERDPNDSGHVNRAIEDLVRREDDKPSFFQVHSCEEVLRIGELYAITLVANPQTTDFLLFPERGLAGFLFSSAPDQNLHSDLQYRHFELQGTDDRLHLESFIRRAFAIVSIARFQRSSLTNAFRDQWCHDPEVLNRCSERWKR
jgi:hypothetical protein